MAGQPNMNAMMKQVQKMQADMVKAAVNEAIRAAQELAASKMNAAAGGLAGPGGLGGLGLPGF